MSSDDRERWYERYRAHRAMEPSSLVTGIAELLLYCSGTSAHLALLAALFSAAVAFTQITTNVATGILPPPLQS